MGLNLDTIEKKVVAALNDLHKPSKHWIAPKLTQKVKSAVGDLGKHLGFTVYATGFGGSSRERTYDLCWRKEGDDDLILDMPLAMECELSPDYRAILEDFQKLLVSRAAHRILLCRQAPELWELCKGELIGQICSYFGTQNGDRYLFGCWMRDGWQFTHYMHQPTPPPPHERVWLFQANKTYILVDKLKRSKKDFWEAKIHRRFLQPGNIVILWQTETKAREAGIYALGELTSAAYEGETGEDDWCVDIRYTGLLKQPILKSTLVKHPALW